MLRTIIFDAVFVAFGSLACWRISKAVRTGSTTYRSAAYSRAGSPTAFWFVTVADAVYLGAAIYGLWFSFGS